MHLRHNARRVIALTTLLLPSCRAREAGAGVYFQTRTLTDMQTDSLERALAGAPFRVHSVRAKRIPGGPTRGEVRLTRGADGSADLDRLREWVRRQAGVVAVGPDSTSVFR